MLMVMWLVKLLVNGDVVVGDVFGEDVSEVVDDVVGEVVGDSC